MFEAGIEATAWARTSTLRLRLRLRYFGSSVFDTYFNTSFFNFRLLFTNNLNIREFMVTVFDTSGGGIRCFCDNSFLNTFDALLKTSREHLFRKFTNWWLKVDWYSCGDQISVIVLRNRCYNLQLHPHISHLSNTAAMCNPCIKPSWRQLGFLVCTSCQKCVHKQ